MSDAAKPSPSPSQPTAPAQTPPFPGNRCGRSAGASQPPTGVTWPSARRGRRRLAGPRILWIRRPVSTAKTGSTPDAASAPSPGAAKAEADGGEESTSALAAAALARELTGAGFASPGFASPNAASASATTSPGWATPSPAAGTPTVAATEWAAPAAGAPTPGAPTAGPPAWASSASGPSAPAGSVSSAPASPASLRPRLRRTPVPPLRRDRRIHPRGPCAPGRWPTPAAPSRQPPRRPRAPFQLPSQVRPPRDLYHQRTSSPRPPHRSGQWAGRRS